MRDVFPRYTARLGLSFADYVEKLRPNPGYQALMPPSHCGASLIHSLVHAPKLHGHIADAFRPLADAGIIRLEPRDLPAGAHRVEGIDNAGRLRDHVAEIVTRRLIAERQVHDTTEELLRREREGRVARAALAETQARLASVVQYSNDAIVTASPDGRFLSWNPTAERLFGYTEEEVLGQHIRIMVPPVEAERQQIRLMSPQSVEPFETLRMAKDGSRVLVSMMVSDVLDGEGRLVARSAIMRDIRAQKEARQRERELRDLEAAHEQLKSTREQLRQSTKLAAMGQMAGGIAHDFNNMLTAIVNFAQFAADDLGPRHPVREDLDEVLKAARKTHALTQQLLAFSRRSPVNPVVWISTAC